MIFRFVTGSETVICSEVLKLKFNLEIHLGLLFECNELKTNTGIVSSVDCTYNGIFLISISMYVVIHFSRT